VFFFFFFFKKKKNTKPKPIPLPRDKKNKKKKKKNIYTQITPKKKRKKRDKRARPYEQSQKQKKKEKKKKVENPLFEKTPRNFSVGGAIQPKRDLTRFVRWPKYVRLQRQKRVLYQRLRVPPAINQFTHTLSKAHAVQLFSLLDKYKPESPAEKRKRLKASAKEIVKDKDNTAAPKVTIRPTIKYGMNHVTHLVEQKQAQLVVIAHDVEPIELVIHLPALCRKLEVPYCIVKSKSRLGQLVRKKTATSLALTEVKKEHQKQLDSLKQILLENFNSNKDVAKAWGGKQLGRRTVASLKKQHKFVDPHPQEVTA